MAKFLGGKDPQLLSSLPEPLHVEFHRILKLNLANMEINLPIGGTKGSTAMWKAYFKHTRGAQDKAFQAVLDASIAIDKKAASLGYSTGVAMNAIKNLESSTFYSWRP